jgi:hypothetical protein
MSPIDRPIRFAQSQARIAHIAGQEADERAWLDMCALLERHESEGWASYAAEQERHAETARRLDDMTREARLSREATGKAVASRISRSEIERALRAADAPEDSMATDDDLIRHEGHAEAVAIMRDMLGLVGDVCRAPGYDGTHVAVGAGAVGSPPYVCHGCGGTFTPSERPSAE